MDPARYAQNQYHVHPCPSLESPGLRGHHDVIPIADLGPVLIASPHPDDETLGCGGLIARCAATGCSVSVLAMTDGEASHPGDRTWRQKLASIRRREQRAALEVLGLMDPNIIALGLADGGLAKLKTDMYERLVVQIQHVIRSRRIRTVFVPAIDDSHSDHRQTARIFADAVAGQPVKYVFSYQIWPPEIRPPQVTTNELGYRHDISDLVSLKRRAIRQHRSQLAPLDPDHNDGFRMPPALIREKLKTQESYALVRDLPAWCSR